MKEHNPTRGRLKAFSVHLAVSTVIYTAILGPCRFFWFPGPLFEAMDGPAMLILVSASGIALGPLLTAVVFNKKKGRKELWQDIAIIAGIQASSLLFGLHLIDENRPKYLVYNSGQFNAISSLMLERGPLPSSINSSLSGPVAIGARQPESTEERNAILFRALAGGPDIYNIPHLLVPYSSVRDDATANALSPESYKKRHGGDISLLRRAISVNGEPPTSQLGILPLMVGGEHSIIVIDKTSGEPVSYGLAEPRPDPKAHLP